MTETDPRLSLSSGIRQRLFWRSHLPKGQTYVYFIQDDPGTPFKIGYTNRAGARVRALQTGNWRELRLVAVLPAPPCVETAYHRMLASERVNLEWFKGPMTSALAVKACDMAEQMMQAYEGSGNAPDIYLFDDQLERPLIGPTLERVKEPIPEIEVVQRDTSEDRKSRVSGDFAGRGMRRGWRSAQIRKEPVVIKMVDPATMDRTPSRLTQQRNYRELRDAA